MSRCGDDVTPPMAACTRAKWGGGVITLAPMSASLDPDFLSLLPMSIADVSPAQRGRVLIGDGTQPTRHQSSASGRARGRGRPACLGRELEGSDCLRPPTSQNNCIRQDMESSDEPLRAPHPPFYLVFPTLRNVQRSSVLYGSSSYDIYTL